MNRIGFAIIFLFVIFSQVACDIYLHNPRGSNNRLNEDTRARANANRMFDSQNNARGGYNVGGVYYYVGTTVRVEWTIQHSCGDQNNHCEIILQYMCDDNLRDGIKTQIIPTNQKRCKNSDCNTDHEYGMHEDFYSYAHCKLRTRNKGLFTADQNVGDSGTKTRQNPAGTRRGYECPEERDYYPYWGPTPWKDIAVFTNSVKRCATYRDESHNVKEKFACKVGRTYLRKNVDKKKPKLIPITKKACEEYQYIENGKLKNGVWQRYSSHGISAPLCLISQPSRDNYLGNGLGGQMLNFNWTVPNHASERCAMRIRYNISTADFDRDNTFSSSNNRGNSVSGVNIWSIQGLNESAGIKRGYKFQNNPTVDVFNSPKLKLQLAVNTAQFGRVFQDRSHYFAIRARPEKLKKVQIENINVRGKRGNIVQVFPSVEYDFVPDKVVVSKNTYVHFQWTGSDNNPAGNEGQGRRKTDRSNVVVIRNWSYDEGNPKLYKKTTYGQLGSSYPKNITNAVFAGFDLETIRSLAINGPQIGGDMEELDDSGTYYDLGPKMVTRSGTYNYMSTRNNNFSNRSHKGVIMILESSFIEQMVDQRGGTISLRDPATLQTMATVEIPSAGFQQPSQIQLWKYSKNDKALPTVKPQNTDYLSDFVYFASSKRLSNPKANAKVKFRLNAQASFGYSPTVYRYSLVSKRWHKVKIARQEGDMLTVYTDQEGYFVASKTVEVGILAGLAIGILVVIILLVAVLCVCCKNQNIIKGYGSQF